MSSCIHDKLLLCQAASRQRCCSDEQLLHQAVFCLSVHLVLCLRYFSVHLLLCFYAGSFILSFFFLQMPLLPLTFSLKQTSLFNNHTNARCMLYTHAHTHTRTCMHTHVHTRTPTQTHTHAHTPTHAHTQTHMQVFTNAFNCRLGAVTFYQQTH